MYIRIPFGVNYAPSVNLGGPSKAPYSTGGQYVGEKDTGKLLTVLRGLSPYQRFIEARFTSGAAARLPNHFLRIVSSPKDVPNEALRRRFVTVNNTIVGGTIDRAAGVIYMLELPKTPGYTRLELALHEAVHLFAHPFTSLIDERTFRNTYGRGCSPRDPTIGTFQRTFCRGFGEGATQAITEQIMEAQGITKYYADRPYEQFTPPAHEIIRLFSADLLGRAYFLGAIADFTRAMQWRWGNAWHNVANYTTAGEKQKALDEIKRLELEYLKRFGPKGDFPTPLLYKKYA